MKDLKVLIAEDESPTAMIIASCLTDEGYEVTTVPNGREAIAELENNPEKYQVLITDLDMPLMSGADLIKKLRIFRFPQEIAVITGNLSPRVKDELTSYKINNIFIKPLDPDELVNFLKNCQIPQTKAKQKRYSL